jgi:hypothetical protein
MNTEQKNEVAQALKAVFDKPCNVKNGTVSVTTMADMTPNQFALLAQASFALGVVPAIKRSSTGVKVAFSLPA